MSSIKSFKDIISWEKAHALVLAIYEITKRFPDIEKFGLVSQMRRAAVSVASNIVEGFTRKSVRDSLNFYNIARASLEELKYQILISFEVNLINNSEYDQLMQLGEEAGRTLNGWISSQKINAGLSRFPRLSR